jgi:hypothetical protein
MDALYLTLPMEGRSWGKAEAQLCVAAATSGLPLVNETYHVSLARVKGVARESYHKVLDLVFT